MTAARVLAATAIDLYENEDLLEKAKEEFKISAADGYTCPIPENEYAKAMEI